MQAQTKTKTKDDPTLFGAALPPAEKTKTAKAVVEAKPAARKPAASKALAVAKPQGPRAVAAPTPTDLLGMLSSAASNKNIDVAKMREIRDLIREVQKDEEAKAFNAAMLACQREIDPIIITRDSDNKHTKSKWARLEKISKLIDPIIRKHGFALSYSMGAPRLPDHYLIVCDVAHTNGHVRRYEADIGTDSKGPKGEGTKSLAQGSGSSASYGRRYLKVMIFDVKIVGEDNDGNRPINVDRHVDARRVEPTNDAGDVEVISEAQHDKLIEAIEHCGVGRPKFCEHYGVGKVAELPAARFNEAMKACADFAENQKAKKQHG